MKIKEQQSEAISKALISSEQVFKEVPHNTILETILNYSEKDISILLGPIGVTLRKFASEIYLLHPGLHSLFSGQLVSNESESFNCVAREALKLSEYVKQSSQDIIKKHIRDLLKKHLFYKKIKSTLKAPSESNNFCRFVHDKNIRNKLRNSYTIKFVNLEPLFKKSKEYWDELPNDFSSLFRHTCQIEDDIKIIKSRYDNLKCFGLNSIANELSKSINKLIETKNETTYFGFNCVSLHRVSGIVAKSLGYQLGDNCIYYTSKNVDSTIGSQNLVTTINVYDPENAHIPEEIVHLVNNLDESKELNGFPLFDRFIILRVVNYLTDELKNSDFPRTLIGEVDGKMYYIAHWYV